MPLEALVTMKTGQGIEIEQALHERTLVRFNRRFEPGKVRGYVLDIGPTFFLLGLVSDRIWLDGYECFRMSDVIDVRPDRHREFAEAALSARGEHIPPKRPKVHVGSLEDLLLSASRAFPLVTIQREELDPDVCFIGR